MVEFEEQYYSPADLSEFFFLMGLDGNSTPVDVIGPNDASNPGIIRSRYSFLVLIFPKLLPLRR